MITKTNTVQATLKQLFLIGALPFHFVLERDPKMFFYCQHDVENFTELVLDFLLFDKHEYGHGIFRSTSHLLNEEAIFWFSTNTIF